MGMALMLTERSQVLLSSIISEATKGLASADSTSLFIEDEGTSMLEELPGWSEAILGAPEANGSDFFDVRAAVKQLLLFPEYEDSAMSFQD